MDDKEILRRVIQGFQLIPAKQGFGHPYVTKTGAATPDLSKRINTWIKQNFPQSNIIASYEGVYKTINFRRVMNENRIRLVDLFEIEGPTRVPKDRIVYAYTFPKQNLAYIGLTGNEKKRAASHKSLKAQKTTAVSRYIRETGLEPEYKIVSATDKNPSGWVDENTAKDLECKYMEQYKANGWNLLNLAKCGSLGGSIRDEKVIINSLDDFIHSTGTELDILNTLPGSDYTVDAIKNYNLEDRVFNRLKDIITANNITSTKQLRKLTSRRVSKLIEDWSRMYREDDSWQEKLFPGNIGSRKAKQKGIDAFLAEPGNLDKDQLKFLTKRSGVGITPEEEEVLLSKLKKIIGKYNIKGPGELNALDPTRKNAFDVMFSLQAGDAIKKGKGDWRDILWPKGYPGRGTGAKRKAAVAESLDSKEVFRRIIKNYIGKS
jgi:hypothetical protein